MNSHTFNTAVKQVILKQEESRKQQKDREKLEAALKMREELEKGQGRTESLKLLSISEVVNSYKNNDNKKSKSVMP